MRGLPNGPWGLDVVKLRRRGPSLRARSLARLLAWARFAIDILDIHEIHDGPAAAPLISTARNDISEVDRLAVYYVHMPASQPASQPTGPHVRYRSTHPPTHHEYPGPPHRYHQTHTNYTTRLTMSPVWRLRPSSARVRARPEHISHQERWPVGGVPMPVPVPVPVSATATS